MPEGEGAVAAEAVEVPAAQVILDVAPLAVHLDAEAGELEKAGEVPGLTCSL
jgi:hypothetical protein